MPIFGEQPPMQSDEVQKSNTPSEEKLEVVPLDYAPITEPVEDSSGKQKAKGVVVATAVAMGLSLASTEAVGGGGVLEDMGSPEMRAAVQHVRQEASKGGFSIVEVGADGRIIYQDKQGNQFTLKLQREGFGGKISSTYNKAKASDFRIESAYTMMQREEVPERRYTAQDGARVIFSEYALAAVRVAGAIIGKNGEIITKQGQRFAFRADPGRGAYSSVDWKQQQFAKNPTVVGCAKGTEGGRVFTEGYFLELTDKGMGGGEIRPMALDEVLKQCR